MICIDMKMPKDCSQCKFVKRGIPADRDCGGIAEHCYLTGIYFTEDTNWHETPSYPQKRPDWCPMHPYNKQIYVVTAGEYSDYHIEKVFSSRSTANMYSMMDPDRQVETYKVDSTDVNAKKSFVKVVYNFGWMDCISSVEFASKEITPYIKVGGYPEFAFVFTLDFSNERIRRAIMNSGKNSRLVEKTAQDKFAEYLYEHETTKEEIIQKHKEEMEKRYPHFPILSTSTDKTANEEVTEQLRQIYAAGLPLPDSSQVAAMIEKAKQEKTK